MKDIICDSYKLLLNTNSRDLLISFGSRGIVKFAQNNYLKNVEINQLHCIDSDGSSWYQNGVKGMGDDIFSLAEHIKDLCNKYRFEKIFCIGASMGAYGALALGALLNAHKVIAISPQIVLHHGWPFAPKKNVILKLKSIKEIVESAHNTQFIVITSSELIDVYHASIIHELNNVHLSILQSPHNVLKTFKRSSFLDEFLGNILTFNGVEELGISSIKLKLSVSQKDLSNYLHLYYYEKNVKEAIPHLNRLVLRNPNWLDAQKALADIYFNEQEYSECLILSMRLYEKLPNNLSILKNLLYIMSDQKFLSSNFHLLLERYLILNYNINGIEVVETLLDLADWATKMKNHQLSVHTRSILINEYLVENFHNYYQLGRSFQNIKDLKQAQRCYLKVLELKSSIQANELWIISKSQERLDKLSSD